MHSKAQTRESSVSVFSLSCRAGGGVGAVRNSNGEKETEQGHWRDCAEMPFPKERGFAAKATFPSPPLPSLLSPFTVQMALQSLIFAVAILTPPPTP